MSKKVMKLVCRHTGWMRCKVCESEHQAMIMSGGKFRRGSWQCVNGCQLEDLKEKPISDPKE